MEIFLWIVVAFIALVIIGKLVGDLDIEKLDIAGLKREIWVTQNWINNYHKGGCPTKYKEKFQYKQSRLEQASAQLHKLTLGRTTNSGGSISREMEDAEPDVSPELASDENFQDFLIVHSMRQLTDLASSQGLIQPPEDAPEYWKMFKERIRNFHLSDEPATLDEVKAAIEEELEPIFSRSLALVNDGVREELALAQCVVNWHKNMKFAASLRAMLLSNEYKAAVMQVMGDRLHSWQHVGEREMLSLTVEPDARISTARSDARDQVVVKCMEIAAIMPQCEHRLVLETASNLLANIPTVAVLTRNVFQS